MQEYGLNIKANLKLKNLKCMSCVCVLMNFVTTRWFVMYLLAICKLEIPHRKCGCSKKKWRLNITFRSTGTLVSFNIKVVLVSLFITQWNFTETLNSVGCF